MKTCPEFSLSYWTVAFCTLEWRAIDPYHVVASKHLFLYFSVFLSFFSLAQLKQELQTDELWTLTQKVWGIFPYVFESWLCGVEWLAGMVVILQGVHSRAFASCESQPLLPLCHCLALLPGGKTNKIDFIFVKLESTTSSYLEQVWDRSDFQLLLYS